MSLTDICTLLATPTPVAAPRNWKPELVPAPILGVGIFFCPGDLTGTWDVLFLVSFYSFHNHREGGKYDSR